MTEKRHISLFGMSAEYPHCNDAQHQQREKLYPFHVHGAVKRLIEDKHVLYRSHKSRAYSGSPGAGYECPSEKHILDRNAARTDYADETAKIGAYVSTIGCYALAITISTALVFPWLN
jgi:hypothetical protein